MIRCREAVASLIFLMLFFATALYAMTQTTRPRAEIHNLSMSFWTTHTQIRTYDSSNTTDV